MDLRVRVLAPRRALQRYPRGPGDDRFPLLQRRADRLHALSEDRDRFAEACADPECDVMEKYRAAYPGMGEHLVAHGIKNAVARRVLACIDFRLHIPTLMDMVVAEAPTVCDFPSQVLRCEVFCAALTLQGGASHRLLVAEVVAAIGGSPSERLGGLLKTLSAKVKRWYRLLPVA